jgi:hypothetical protein
LNEILKNHDSTTTELPFSSYNILAPRANVINIYGYNLIVSGIYMSMNLPINLKILLTGLLSPVIYAEKSIANNLGP